MPTNVVVKKRYKKLLTSLLQGMSIVIGISFVVNLGIFIYKNNYDGKVEQQLSLIDQKIGAQTDSNIQDVIRDKIIYKNEVYENLKKIGFDVNGILTKIEKMIPTDVSISALNINDKGLVTIDGNADSENSVLDFFYNLKKSDLTDYVKFEGLDGKFGDGKGFKFSFEFQLKGIGSDIIETN